MSVRAVVAVLACVATLAFAQGKCPTSSLSNVYSDTTCSTTASALSTACSCIGLTYSSSTGACVGVSTASCSTFNTCALAYINSINQAAIAGSSCSSASTLKAPLATLAAGGIYTGSAVESACQSSTCMWANATTATCTNNLANLWQAACVNPYMFVGTIVITGNFVCTAANIAAYKVALRIDLSAALGYNVTIIGDIVCGSATATFSVPVSQNAAGLQANLQAAQANAAFLTSFAAAAGVPVSALTVQSIVAVSTTVPGSSPVVIQSAARASWTILSVLVAAIAFAF